MNPSSYIGHSCESNGKSIKSWKIKPVSPKGPPGTPSFHHSPPSSSSTSSSLTSSCAPIAATGVACFLLPVPVAAFPVSRCTSSRKLSTSVFMISGVTMCTILIFRFSFDITCESLLDVNEAG
ncbi:unnamed protein product, partial [Musa acuminata subsp. burmannicoides]